MKIIGLTGSIGMGKSTTAGFFREAGIPVHDADGAVHALYAGKAAPLIEAAFPGSTTANGVDRSALAAQVLDKPAAMKRLEAIIHPLVREAELAAIAEARRMGHRLMLLDIPLLFETGAGSRCNVIVVVSSPPEVQRTRVLARPGMTEDKFAAILKRQLPDVEKRRRAHYVVDTSRGFEAARRDTNAIIRAIG